jgi:hypothetical protein
MQCIEINKVNRGECMVLRGAHKDILMLDCPSGTAGAVRQGDSFAVITRYADAADRTFLLTHCKREYLYGLKRLLNLDSGYFHRIYLPAAPCDKHGRPLLLEFALFAFVFLNRQDDFYSESTALLHMLSRTAKKAGANRIFTLNAKDTFVFDGVQYEVLWPAEKSYPFSTLFVDSVEKMNICLSSPFLPDAAGEFLRLKEEFSAAYLACCQSAPLKQTGISHVYTILEQIKNRIPQLLLLPPAPDIIEILGRPVTRDAFRHELCAASIIFQNIRKREASLGDILMTGAAAPESMDAVADRLHGSYYILKVPQHGAACAWSHLFGEISASHILISNSNEKLTAAEYAELPAVKHCTDCAACAWYRNSGCSCNRIACCYELPSGPGLTIKCPRCRDSRFSAPCGIRTVPGERPCLCDGKPIELN